MPAALLRLVTSLGSVLHNNFRRVHLTPLFFCQGCVAFSLLYGWSSIHFPTLLSIRLIAAAGGPIEVFKFPEEVLEATEAAGMPLPFAVIGSRESDETDGDVVPVRHYPWGTCLPLRKEHSDAVFFRCCSHRFSSSGSAPPNEGGEGQVIVCTLYILQLL